MVATLYSERRQMVMDAYGPGSVIVVHGAHEQIRNSDVEHAFRQDSDFWFLTGFHEPDSVLVLVPGRAGEEVVLFVRPRDRERETWTGRRAGVEGAVARHGADKAFDIAELDKELGRLCEGAAQVVFSFGRDAAFDARVFLAARRHRTLAKLGLDGPDAFADLQAVLSEMRLHKSAADIRALRRAGAVTAEAHHEAMRLCAPGVNERELHATLEYVFRAMGSARVGYGCIVATGANGTILHYHDNDQPIADGDLVLIDAGAEVDGFTADVTRTFPANGRFTPEQRAVYDVVLAAQLASIDQCRVGRTFDDMHMTSVRVLTQGMLDLGLLRATTLDEAIEKETYKRYYMHRTGHWLGMDVHDVGKYRLGGVWRPLQAGMVLTVEPGLYIAEDDAEAPAGLRGIGVRIEDDILVTDGEPDNLTGGCVKEPAAVEALVGLGPRWVRQVVG
ncbi:MAG: M24 family metallopeptidase [Myxococcales bacterium]|nr:M24 family metallopeptidase [Myxococcales bacterium]